jgi:hypothetical protein
MVHVKKIKVCKNHSNICSHAKGLCNTCYQRILRAKQVQLIIFNYF